MWPIWVSTETAIQMQQSGQGIKLIRPFCRSCGKNGPMAFFPLYFSEYPLYMQEVVATQHKCPKTHDFFWVVPEVWRQPQHMVGF